MSKNLASAIINTDYISSTEKSKSTITDLPTKVSLKMNPDSEYCTSIAISP